MREGYKVTELGEIPEDWEVVKLSDIGTIITGNTPSTKIKTHYAGIDGLLWASPSDLGKQKYVTKTARTLSQGGFNQTRKIPRGSILVTCIGSTIGKIGMAFEEMATNQQINSLACNSLNECNFFFYVLQSKAEYIKSLAGTQAVPLLNKSDFSNIFLIRPPLPEQQKIASILSTVDEKIEVIDEQIKQTQELKKGLMQQLLTKGTGPTKFKSSELGQIPESWVVVSLGDVLKDMKSGLSRKLSIQDIGLPVIRSNNLDKEEVTFEEIKYWYLDDPQGANTNDYFLRDGDILISFINSRAQIGKSAMFFDKIKRPAIYTTNILKLTVKENISRRFIYYCTKTAQYDNFIQLITKPAVNQASFTTKDFKRYKIALPEFEEQYEIASILSTVDEKIDILKSKKQTYQQLKKGLMQQLLTGKVRLKIHQQETSLA